MPLHAIIFDLDDTLLDRNASMRTYAATAFLESFGACLDTIDVEQIYQAIVHADAGGYLTPDEKSMRLRDALTWRNAPTIEELSQHWEQQYSKSATAMPGLFPMLDLLKQNGYKLGIITNGGNERQNEKVDLLNIRPYMDIVLVSGGVIIDGKPVHKPDSRIFHLALEKLGVGATQACYIGDYPQNDIIGATNAGLHAIWRVGFHAWPDGLPEPKYQIDTLDQVWPVLQQLEREIGR